HRGVDAAADCGDHFAIADGSPDLLDFALAIVAEVPRWRAVRDVEEKVADDRRPGLAVRHLGMELDSEALPRGALECRDRCIRRRCGGAEPLRLSQDFVAVTGP